MKNYQLLMVVVGILVLLLTSCFSQARGNGGDPEFNPGDVNGDGIVNAVDLNIVLFNFTKDATGLTRQQGNLVGDATIDNKDLNQILFNFGKQYPSGDVIVVPEPGSLGLIGLGALSLAARRRRA